MIAEAISTIQAALLEAGLVEGRVTIGKFRENELRGGPRAVLWPDSGELGYRYEKPADIKRGSGRARARFSRSVLLYLLLVGDKPSVAGVSAVETLLRDTLLQLNVNPSETGPDEETPGHTFRLLPEAEDWSPELDLPLKNEPRVLVRFRCTGGIYHTQDFVAIEAHGPEVTLVETLTDEDEA